MSAVEKCGLLAGVPERFPGGVRQTVRRAFAGGDVAVLEVEGDGLFLGERPYRNRYCFLISTRGDRVTSVREYLDTAHSAAVFDGRHLDRRSETEPPTDHLEVSPGCTAAVETAVRRFFQCLSTGDGEGLLAACTPDATWWADGGATRTDGPEAPAESDPEVVVVGRVPLALRTARIGRFAETYPEGFLVVPHRITVDDEVASSGLVAVEARGHGVHRNGSTYQNRYAFVLRMEIGDAATAALPRIQEIREYCDTRHAFDVYGIHR